MGSFVDARRWAPISIALLIASGVSAAPGPTAPANLTTPAPPPAPPSAPTAAPAPASSAVARTEANIPEGTEVRIRFNDRLSSATNVEGDEFGITTDEPITLSDGTVIPAGFRGKGEVTAAHKKGMLGKAGELNIRIDYIRIGDTRVRLRAVAGGEGKSGVGTTVALSLIVSPLFLMHHGAEVVYAKGRTLTAFVDQDTKIPLPLPRPPQVD